MKNLIVLSLILAEFSVPGLCFKPKTSKHENPHKFFHQLLYQETVFEKMEKEHPKLCQKSLYAKPTKKQIKELRKVLLRYLYIIFSLIMKTFVYEMLKAITGYFYSLFKDFFVKILCKTMAKLSAVLITNQLFVLLGMDCFNPVSHGLAKIVVSNMKKSLIEIWANRSVKKLSKSVVRLAASLSSVEFYLHLYT